MDGIYSTPVECCYIRGDSLTADRRGDEFGAGQWEVKGMLSLLLTQIDEFIQVRYSLKRGKTIQARFYLIKLEQGQL